MTSNQDARPFVDLNKDAQEFQQKFEEDIKECLCFLDAKITSLICEPDSFGTQGKSIHQNALVEFSKAKYDIFISVKSLITAKEREWLTYIAEMKKLFIENVEIFLAGTKLEVKLPPSESVPSCGPRKSPGNRKSTTASATSSIYPLDILNSIMKNIPGSSSQEKDSPTARSKANVGDKIEFNRRGKLSTSSIKLVDSPYDEEEMDIGETELDRSRSRSSSDTRSRKLSNSGLNTSQSNLGRRNSFKKETDLGLNDKDMSVLEKCIDNDVSESVNDSQLPTRVRGRRGKLAEKNPSTYNKSNEKNTSVLHNQNDTKASETVVTSKTRGRKGKLTQVNSSALNDLDAVMSDCNNVGGKQKGTKSKRAVVENHSSTDENEGQTTEMNGNEIPLKGRRGRSAPKAKPNDFTVVSQNISNNTSEILSQATETKGNKNPVKGPRGRSASKTNDASVVSQNVSNNTAEIESETTETKGKGRRGRLASKTNDATEPSVSQKIVGRSRRGAKSVIEEEINEPGPSKPPRQITFSGDHSSSDELEIQTPLARPVKSGARRKTLLPNLEDISGADIIPGNPSRSISKRKTISGVSELESMAPSKRLKVSQKAISSQVSEDDSSANDNLLESDGNYSDWMALKSVDGKIPTRPAVYELKVWRAKKPAYIGSCESLRQKLTLYNLRQNSGHKHLDKFIDRNYNDIQVRFEVVASFDDAKDEAKNRIKSFAAQHKTNPAYN